MSSKVVRYERVNIDDIDTSSDDDDYGDLFANERSRITSNGRRSKMMPARKGTKTKYSWCCRSLAAILFVLAILLILAGVALYLDPKDGLQMFTPKFGGTNTTALVSEETQNVTAVANSTTVFNNNTEGGKIISEELNSTISDAMNTTAETIVTSDENIGDTRETMYPTSFGVWSTLSSSSSSYGLK